MREGSDNQRTDPRSDLMRTIEAAARRWYPWGVPHGAFERVIAASLTEQAQCEPVEDHPASIEECTSRKETASSANTVPLAEPSPHHLRAQFLVPRSLTQEEESLLTRAVTQGLQWRRDEVTVVVCNDLCRIKMGVPIFVCGVPGALASLGGTVDHHRMDEMPGRWNGSVFIESVALSDALTSREAKRRLWSHLKILLAAANE